MKRAPLSRDRLKALSRRSNAHSIRSLLAHFGLLAGLGFLVAGLFEGGHWLLVVPALMAYGVVFSFLGYAGLGHELSHGTVLTSRPLNDALFFLVSFLTWNNPAYFRLSHRVHHRHTLEQGVDFEVSPAPSKVIGNAWKSLFFDWEALVRAYRIFSLNARGLVEGPFARRFIAPQSAEHNSIVLAARWIVGLHGFLALVYVATGFYQGFILITFAAFVCTWPNRVLARLQHEGMQCNPDDLTASCRSVLLPRWLAFFYWNMNYHQEHHMYPAVPYYNLPELRNELIANLPGPVPSGISECISTLKNY